MFIDNVTIFGDAINYGFHVIVLLKFGTINNLYEFTMDYIVLRPNDEFLYHIESIIPVD